MKSVCGRISGGNSFNFRGKLSGKLSKEGVSDSQFQGQYFAPDFDTCPSQGLFLMNAYCLMSEAILTSTVILIWTLNHLGWFRLPSFCTMVVHSRARAQKSALIRERTLTFTNTQDRASKLTRGALYSKLHYFCSLLWSELLFLMKRPNQS